MASTVTASTMTVTISESITLNGKNQGGTQTFNISSISDIFQRIVSCTASQTTTIASFNADVHGAAGAIDIENSKYIRITNLDDTNHVTLLFKNENNNEFAVKLDKGQTFIYNGDLSGGVVDTMDADSSALSVGLGDLVNITATADTAACDVEVFVACK